MTKYGFVMIEFVAYSIAKKSGFVATEFVTNSAAIKSGFCCKKALSLALSRQNLLQDFFLLQLVDDITSSFELRFGRVRCH